MKRLILSIFTLVTIFTSFAQMPQFAVVRPDGTTYICPTWDSAYNRAVNGDNIYLPGVTINSQINLDKRLNIYGAGHHPDSSAATGKTTTNTSLFFKSGSVGSTVEGVQISGGIYLQYSGKKIRDLIIKRCRFLVLNFSVGTATPVDSFPQNITITENLINDLNGLGTSGSGSTSGNSITKNIIWSGMSSISDSYFSNNIFRCADCNFFGFNNNIFDNNIFMGSQPFYNGSTCANVFNNNLKLGNLSLLAGCPLNTGTETNTISVPAIGDIFINYDASGNGYPYLDNYHLKPTCPGINAGTDGTDVGIYGTSSPTSQGWVPSNPHIYFKQVAPQTNTNGQLQIQFKVRTNN